MRWIALVGALGCAEALAGADALGPAAAPWSGELTAPALGPAAAADARLGLGLAAEWVRRPVVRVVERGAAQEVEPLLDDVLITRLGVAWSPHERVALGLTAPVALVGDGAEARGAGLGSVELSAALGLWRGEAGALAAVPFAVVPSGGSAGWLRDDGVGGGLLLAGAAVLGPVTVHGSGGVERRAASSENLGAGVVARGHLGAALGLGERAALLAEARGRGLVGGGAPIEAGLGARWVVREGVLATVLAGRGLTAAAGSPAARVTAGVVVALGRAEATGPQPEASPRGPRLVVLDPDGAPVPGATVRADGVELGRTDAEGALVSRRLRGAEVVVDKPGHLTATASRLPLTASGLGAETSLTLPWAPVPTRIEVADQRGGALPATLVVRGAAGAAFEVPVVDGAATFSLAPGAWTVEAAAEGFSPQRRALIAAPGRVAALEARVLLAPESSSEQAASAVVVVTDAGGAPLEGVELWVDGLPYGTTGSGGALDLTGLTPGPHRVEALGERFEPLSLGEVTLGPGANALDLSLRRRPGGLRLRVIGPDGPVEDAVARLVGPARLPAVPLGSDGERLFQVRPGAWTVVVTSARLGVQSVEVQVHPDQAALAEVEVYLAPPEGGTASLAVLATDPDGRPVDGAGLWLDGERVGTTASGGRVVLDGLAVGSRRLEVRAPLREEAERELFLVAGPQEARLVVEWAPGATELRARAEGPVGDGVARFAGPRPVAPLPLGEDGVGLAALAPGAWTAVVSSPTWGVAEREVRVGEADGRLTVAEVVLRGPARGEAVLELTVADPEGRPVAGAEVRVGGVLVGLTDTAGRLRAAGLPEGEVAVAVRSPLHGELVRRQALRAGDNALSLPAGWAPGAVRVVAEGPDGPVDDAVVRFVGPERLAPARVDERGERRLVLGPGRWQAVGSSPRHGLAEAVVEIDTGDVGLRTVRLAFGDTAAGLGELLVRVVDPRGNPLPGAAVEVGERVARTAGEAGVVLLRDLPPGPVSLRLNADLHYPRELRDVEIRPGAQERIVVLRPVPGTVVATVTDGAGAPLDGELRFLGPEDVAPVGFVGGAARVELPPGAWRVLAVAAGHAARGVDVEIAPGAREWPIALTLEPAHLERVDGGVVIGESVLFDVGADALRDEAGPTLDELATYLLADPTLAVVEVQGHTDGTGGLALNYALSARRAQAVVAALVARGVPPERLVARGYGPSRPLADEASPEGRARNRRVQLLARSE